eukprot:7879977-Lingulodinium_polyedra.AAC.1
MLQCLEAAAKKRARAIGAAVVPAEKLVKAFQKDCFARATDWVVQLAPSVHLRYSCDDCHEFPVRACDFVR